jgi:hypothetical protein
MGELGKSAVYREHRDDYLVLREASVTHELQ